MTLILLALGAWAAVELLAALGARWLHHTTGVFYSPRDAPRSSRACRSFLERLVCEGGRGRLLHHSSTLGWTVAPERRDAAGRRETDAHGARSRRVHEIEPRPGRLRVATFGDCLTFGEGVPVEDTWQAQMERLDPRLEVLNFGVDGYGLDQCFLRYVESLERYRGQGVVLIGFVSSNVYKSVNAFRPFYSHDHDIRLAKPRFELRGGDLVCIDNPMQDVADYERLLRHPERELRRLGLHDDYYQATYRRGPLDVLPSVRLARTIHNEYRKLRRVRRADGRFVEGSAALRTTLAVADAFCDRVRLQAATPIVLLVPTPADLRRYVRRSVVPWEPVANHLVRRGEHVVDLLPVLAGGVAAGEPPFAGRHLTARANARIARHLVDHIAAHTATAGEAPAGNITRPEAPPRPAARAAEPVPGAGGASGSPTGMPRSAPEGRHAHGARRV